MAPEHPTPTNGAPPAGGPAQPEPIPLSSLGLSDLAPVAAMGLMFLASQLMAVFVAGPFEAAGIRAFEDPEDPLNAIWYIGLIIVFTVIILLIAKYKLDWLIQLIILTAIGATMVYVFWPLLAPLLFDPLRTAGLSVDEAGFAILGLSLLMSGALTVLLWKWPEWYIVDSVGVFVAAGATAIFGVSFGVFPALILLVLLAVYDYISVYKTKHMLSLADSVVGLRLPIMLVVPKHKDYSFLAEKENLTQQVESGKRREAMFMGLGDLVIPSVMIVVAFSQVGSPLAAVGALLGTFAGFAVLMSFVLRGKPHAGLPSLNGGSIAGFFIGFALSGRPWGVLGIPGIG